MKNIIVADDHAIVRDGLEMLLSPIYGDENVTTVPNGKKLLEALAQQSYDLAIVDIQLPDIMAFSLVPAILERWKAQKIMVFSMYPENTMAKIMLDLGAMGYLNKEANQKTTLKAVETILNGEKYLSETLMLHFSSKFLNKETTENPVETLSARELEVLMCLLKGEGVLEIANALDLSSSTIATYKSRIFEKMGVKNIIELHNKGLLLGLV